MNGRAQNVFLEKAIFVFYHCLVAFGSIFALNYFSLDNPEIEQVFERMVMGQTRDQVDETERISNLPVLEKLSGDVRVFVDEFSGSEREAVNHDILKAGYTIETKEDASVVMNLGYNNLIRLLPNTKVKLEEIRQIKVEGEVSKEHTLLTLLKGQLMSSTELTPEKTIDIRARLARYSLQTSQSGIATDGLTFNYLAVKRGEVRAENSKTLKFLMINSKQTFFVDQKGRERKSALPEGLDLFDWYPDSKIAKEINESLILSSTGGPFIVSTEEKFDQAGLSAEMIANLEAQVAQEMKDFKEDNSQLASKIAADQSSFNELKKRHEKEALKVYADITCLETNKHCDLYSEKLLLSRGFARIHNSSRLSASIIKDLRLYLDEQSAVRFEGQKELDALIKLENRRKEVWNWVQSRLADKTQLREILAKLTDPTLAP